MKGSMKNTLTVRLRACLLIVALMRVQDVKPTLFFGVPRVWEKMEVCRECVQCVYVCDEIVRHSTKSGLRWQNSAGNRVRMLFVVDLLLVMLCSAKKLIAGWAKNKLLSKYESEQVSVGKGTPMFSGIADSILKVSVMFFVTIDLKHYHNRPAATRSASHGVGSWWPAPRRYTRRCAGGGEGVAMYAPDVIGDRAQTLKFFGSMGMPIFELYG
jgi:hypothetical protein